MFYLTLGMELIGAKAALNCNETHCAVCGEPINYAPPEHTGKCSCGYCTEEGS